MHKNLIKVLFLGILLFVMNSALNAQSQIVSENQQRNIIVVGAQKTASVTGKVAYFVVKATAKASWETTKFATKEVAAPIAKTILLKATPKVSKFLLKKAVPIATKLILTYLKL